MVYLSVDDELSILSRNVALEDAVGGVVFEHVDHVVKIDEGIVDGDDVDVISGQGSSADESKFKLIFMFKRNLKTYRPIRPNPLIPMLTILNEQQKL